MTEYWFVFKDSSLLLLKHDPKKILTTDLIHAYHFSFLRQHQLGSFNECKCYCAELDANAILPDTLETVSLRKAFDILGKEWFKAAAKAYSIINWDKNHQYCGRCGNVTLHKLLDTYERLCSVCGLALYPRISPSVIVLIKNQDHLLMARSPHFTPGAYGLIAGFVEAGESLEEALHREVKEEVNLEIKDLHYFGSQSWPFPDSLMVGFTAEYASGEIEIDKKEIESAGWYRFDALPGRPSTSISLAGQLIDHFISEQRQKVAK